MQEISIQYYSNMNDKRILDAFESLKVVEVDLKAKSIEISQNYYILIVIIIVTKKRRKWARKHTRKKSNVFILHIIYD